MRIEDDPGRGAGHVDDAMSEGRPSPKAGGAATNRSAGRLAPVAAALLLAACGGDGPTENGNGTVEGLDLDVGEVAVRPAAGEVLRLELPAGTEGRTYVVAAQSDVRQLGVTPMRLAMSGGSDASGSVAPSATVAPLGRRVAETWTRAADLAARVEIQEQAKRLLRARNVRAARPTPGTTSRTSSQLAPSFSSMLPDSEPVVGQQIKFWYPVERTSDGRLTINCDTAQADTITAEVKAAGQRAIMVEDTAVDDAASLQMDYQSLADEFDAEIFGTDVEYFGQPTDIDGNGKVYVLFTKEVNDLTEPDDPGIISGFFLATDLAESGDDQKEGTDATSIGEEDGVCEASNEAEVLYLLAPDPNGDFGKNVDVERAKRSARGTSAHEFQHLLNTGNRVSAAGDFTQLEDTWLDEALSHVAEEAVGLSKTGDPIRSNLTLADVTETQDEVDAFNQFHIANFARLAEYMALPDTTRALALSDPGGAESLRMRGFVWAFTRWLADQEAAASAGAVPGSGEENFFRALAKADGTNLNAGVDNVESVTGRSWSVLLEDFGLMPAVDDTLSPVDPRITLPTWDLRAVFRSLNQQLGDVQDSPFDRAYPLDVTRNAFAPDTVDFEVQGSTQKYFSFDGSGASSPIVIQLSNQAGTALSASSGARLLIVRTR